MDPATLGLITTHGLPLLIASAVFVAIKVLRMQMIQTVLAMISAKLVWNNWPKPVCAAIVALFAGLGALIPALMQGTALSQAIMVAVTAALAAMGIDAGHGAIAQPASSASIQVPIPPAKAVLVLLAVGALSLTSCSMFVPTNAVQCDQALLASRITTGVLGACAAGTGLSAVFPQNSNGQRDEAATAAACGLVDVAAVIWQNSLDTQCHVMSQEKLAAVAP